jgi:hypothetical protein
MKQFDYRTAWHEVAHPAYLKLSPGALAALGTVKVEAADLHQQQDLDMPWTPTIRTAFEPLTTAELATASRAVYFAGHWHPEGVESAVLRGDGAAWKFALYADQLLSERLGLPRGPSKGNGTSYRILEGALRVGWSTPSSWSWREINYASPELLAELQEDPARPTISAGQHNSREWAEWADRMAEWATARTSSDPFFSTERFMVERAAS